MCTCVGGHLACVRACVSVFSGEGCVMKYRVAVGLTGRTIIFETRAQKLNSLNDIWGI